METTEVSDVQTSVDPAPSLLEPGERSPFDKPTAASMVGLVYLARQTLEEKRRRQCLEVTNAILKIEPEHPEALEILKSVRSDLARDFELAQSTARRARLESDPKLCGQAVTMLRRIIDAEPANIEAQNLLHECVAAGYFSTSAVRSDWKWKRRSIVAGSVVAAVVLAAAAMTSGSGGPQASPPLHPPAVSIPNEPPSNPVSFPPFVELTEPVTAAGVSVSVAARPASLTPATPPPADRVESATVAAPIPPPPIVTSTGGLAVNAAVPVEVYRGEEHLGSTPLTLQLPSGPQTLEYRYQGLRQTLTHLITANETTTASVSFVTKVQINAKPWAQVFIDGTRLTPIGQTPLGDVSVPVGSVLVFQNPGYSDKRYRVTARDAAIQVTFP